ncbi:MAG: NlpC/P60 family protein [Deltaproteobacteria bacterium]|nr:NlpC/P60 family protein [Deltaproteobacteria bacterium]
MTRRRIILSIGHGVFFASLILCGNLQAKETYRIRQGDTLFAIAAKTGVAPAALKTANNLRGSRIKASQLLILPSRNQTEAQLDNPLRRAEARVGNTKSEAPPESGKELNDADQGREETWAETGKPREDNADHSDSGKWCNPEEPKLLVKAALGFLGTPYRWGGFSIKGIDCSGLVKKIYQFFDIDLPRTAFEQSRVGMRVARSELVEGDLLFFNTRKPPIGHVGIYIGNNQFIHAPSRNKRVRVDSLSKPYYDKRFVRAVRPLVRDDAL